MRRPVALRRPRTDSLLAPRRCLITVLGLKVASEWRVVHDRLLDGFPGVADVLPTTMEGTVLILYHGHEDTNAWLETVSETVLHCRARLRTQATPPQSAVS
jgi:hypothetical protein